jgi:transposase
LAGPSIAPFCSSPSSFHRFNHRASPSTRSRCAQKNGGDQALGRSSGGLTTKIHAAVIDLTCSVALHLTPGQANDGRQFEAIYQSLPEENVLEAACLDKGYDANRIRETLACDGIEPVVPPKKNRREKPPYDKELYKQRNQIERFFNKIKHFRRIATRYDKLAATYSAALFLVASFVLIRNS